MEEVVDYEEWMAHINSAGQLVGNIATLSDNNWSARESLLIKQHPEVNVDTINIFITCDDLFEKILLRRHELEEMQIFLEEQSAKEKRYPQSQQNGNISNENATQVNGDKHSSEYYTGDIHNNKLTEEDVDNNDDYRAFFSDVSSDDDENGEEPDRKQQVNSENFEVGDINDFNEMLA